MRVNRKIREKMQALGMTSLAAAARDCGLSKQTFRNSAVLGRELIPAHQKILDAWLDRPVHVADPPAAAPVSGQGAA